jgi:hypothetical protein
MTWGSSTQKDIFDKDNGLLTQVGGWIGAMTLTPEEVLKQNVKTVDSVQAYAIATLSESTDRSKTRRSIAVIWIKSNLAIVFFACIAAPFNLELAGFYFSLATSVLMISVTSAITIFFYGSYGIARVNESKKTKE